jgi:hypothetical protein
MRESILWAATSLFVAMSLFFFQLLTPPNNKSERQVHLDEGRNEGSTPRSFILPATPAVALIQEAKLERKVNEKMIKGCLLSLIDSGFYVRDLDDIHDDQIPITLIKYQFYRQISRTGKLDENTRRLLGC